MKQLLWTNSLCGLDWSVVSLSRRLERLGAPRKPMRDFATHSLRSRCSSRLRHVVVNNSDEDQHHDFINFDTRLLRIVCVSVWTVFSVVSVNS